MSVPRLDKPTTNRAAQTIEEMIQIVMHPAFRLGFLDAQQGRPPDQDRIIDRIYAETPPAALRRLGWLGLFDRWRGQVDIAEYRYEEGRLLHLNENIRCRAWGRPDYPPAGVRDFIYARAAQGGGRRGSAGTVKRAGER